MPKGPPFYAVATSWLARWIAYASDGGAQPGCIDNAPLVGYGHGDGREAAWLSADDWHFLYELHGGGPVLCRPAREIFPQEEQATADAGAGSASSSSAPPASSSRGSGTGGVGSGRGGGADAAAGGRHWGLYGGDPCSGGDAGGASGGAGGGIGSASPASVGGQKAEAAVREASLLHAARCRELGRDLASVVANLEKGPWSRRATKAVATARARVRLAVGPAACGGEELKAALQALRATRVIEGLGRLDELVFELCTHEEAQIVLACIQQALRDSDRLGLELWTEQADAMCLEELVHPTVSIIALLRESLTELEERERRALAGHAPSSPCVKEGPAERLWRQVVFATEANDEPTLVDIIEEAMRSGIDASAAKLALEELQSRRAAREEPQKSNGAFFGGGVGGAGAGSWTFGERRRASAPDLFGGSRYNRTTLEEDLEDLLMREEADRAREARARAAADERERWRKRWEEEAERRRRAHEEDRQRREEERRQRYEGDDEFWRRQRAQGNTWGRTDGDSYFNSAREEQQQRRRYNSVPAAGINRGEALAALGLPPLGGVPALPALKAAYKTAAMRSHPDRPQNRGRQREATAEFQRVKAAFDLLAGV